MPEVLINLVWYASTLIAPSGATRKRSYLLLLLLLHLPIENHDGAASTSKSRIPINGRTCDVTGGIIKRAGEDWKDVKKFLPPGLTPTPEHSIIMASPLWKLKEFFDEKFPPFFSRIYNVVNYYRRIDNNAAE